MLQIITLLWKLFNMLYNSFQFDIFWIFFCLYLNGHVQSWPDKHDGGLSLYCISSIFCVVLHFAFKTLICFMLLLSVMRLMGRLSFPSSFFRQRLCLYPDCSELLEILLFQPSQFWYYSLEPPHPGLFSVYSFVYRCLVFLTLFNILFFLIEHFKSFFKNQNPIDYQCPVFFLA